ncbi:hypothetical protein ACJ72_08076 [Emergomyces africanus]|uniref:Uncharacterized protein n=1 Tax=Emergomyces africanus TaxID=1955775 RepID=A0A1B7NLC5_9EURO|nr:hypothetical protein ACJ72_08076 [Emergomyces africanus]
MWCSSPWASLLLCLVLAAGRASAVAVTAPGASPGSSLLDPRNTPTSNPTDSISSGGLLAPRNRPRPQPQPSHVQNFVIKIISNSTRQVSYAMESFVGGTVVGVRDTPNPTLATLVWFVGRGYLSWDISFGPLRYMNFDNTTAHQGVLPVRLTTRAGITGVALAEYTNHLLWTGSPGQWEGWACR